MENTQTQSFFHSKKVFAVLRVRDHIWQDQANQNYWKFWFGGQYDYHLFIIKILDLRTQDLKKVEMFGIELKQDEHSILLVILYDCTY